MQRGNALERILAAGLHSIIALLLIAIVVFGAIALRQAMADHFQEFQFQQSEKSK